MLKVARSRSATTKGAVEATGLAFNTGERHYPRPVTAAGDEGGNASNSPPSSLSCRRRDSHLGRPPSCKVSGHSSKDFQRRPIYLSRSEMGNSKSWGVELVNSRA